MASSSQYPKQRQCEAPAEPHAKHEHGSAGASHSHTVIAALRAGTVIPAHPLALNSSRKIYERRQRALSRYYIAAGAGGLAVSVHTTQFAIHDPKVGLLRPVLELAANEMDVADKRRNVPLIRVAGICGATDQAVHEAELPRSLALCRPPDQAAHQPEPARSLGYQFGLVSLAAFQGAATHELLQHCRSVARTIDLFGFYLQPAVGGIELPYEFWRGFCEIPNARAVKIATFDRYRTITVVRAVAESGRYDIALYTGNDDNIVADLLNSYEFLVE